MNPKHGCNLCDQKFGTAREAKRHKKMHLVGCVGLPVHHDEDARDSVQGQGDKEYLKQQEGGGVRDNYREGVQRQGSENELRTNEIPLGSEMVERVCNQTRTDGEMAVSGGNMKNNEVQINCTVESVGWNVEASEKEILERHVNNAKSVGKEIVENDQREAVGTLENAGQEKQGAVRITSDASGNYSECVSPEQRDGVKNTTHTSVHEHESRENVNTSDTNEASEEAIRKILEGKPFICPLCDKGFSSRNGLRHHYYKTHENHSDQKRTHLYYCRECKEGFKTEKKFWFHNVNVHGLIETSSDESDSEMAAVRSTMEIDAGGKATCITEQSEIGVTSDFRGREKINGNTSANERDDSRTNRNDSMVKTGVEMVDGRMVVQSKITDWFCLN